MFLTSRRVFFAIQRYTKPYVPRTPPVQSSKALLNLVEEGKSKNEVLYKTIKNTNPAYVSKIIEKDFASLPAPQLIDLLSSYLITNKTKLYTGSKLYEHLWNICIYEIENLSLVHICSLLSIFKRSRFQDEALYLSCAKEILKRDDEMTSRARANALIALAYPVKKTGALLFYFDFAERNLSKYLEAKDLKVIDFTGIFKGLSQGQVLRPESLSLIEDKCIDLIDNGKEEGSIHIFADSFFANRKIYKAERFWERFQKKVIDEQEKFSISNLSRGVSQLSEFNLTSKKHIGILLDRMSLDPERVNIMDALDAYNAFFSFIKQNRERCFKEKGESDVLNFKMMEDFNLICAIFNDLYTNLSGPDFVVVLSHMNIVIPQRTENSIKLVKNIKEYLKFNLKRNLITTQTRAKLFDAIKDFQEEKIMKVFVNLLRN